MAWELWTIVLSWFAMRWVMSRSVMELLIAWRGEKVGKAEASWFLISLCLMWIIWQERNSRCFDGVENPLYRIKSFLVLGQERFCIGLSVSFLLEVYRAFLYTGDIPLIPSSI
ncbi:hypothetical protein RHMOL_Rhmol07G0182900 [Rhododendron molle]|nr:hypothetical protein RHMOL_Rhmol07G0182900 [Rhododendron molle]